MSLGRSDQGKNKINELFSKFLNWVFGLRLQLIIPYVLLTLVISMGGVFIITRLVTSSVRERFTNQLLESSRVSADGIVGVEDAHLENLRLMSFTLPRKPILPILTAGLKMMSCG